ncbi:MAG: four helix bundle protein [Nitrospirota bacterium]
MTNYQTTLARQQSPNDDQITRGLKSSNRNQQTSTKTKKFDLEERTLEFAKAIVRLCKQLPQNVINLQFIGQLIRCSGSVGANYREANDSLSKKDFSYRIKICRKEAKESCFFLELLAEANPEFADKIEVLFEEANELKKIFSSIADKSS